MSTAFTLTLPEAMQRAIAAYQSGNWIEAERLCRLVLAAATDHLGALNLLGAIAAQTRRTQESVALMSQVVSLDRNNAASHNNLGNVLLVLKRPESALESFNRAIALRPDHADTYYNRGNALWHLKRPEAALESYDRAIALKPDYAEAFYNRGTVLCDLKRPEAALESFERAIALGPDCADAYCNRGTVLRDLGRPEAALQSYDRAIALKPDYAEAYYNRGTVLCDLKRPEAALESFERAIAIRPDYAEAYSNRGTALRDLERPEAALESFERAITLRPDNAEAYSNRGNALSDLKRPEAALESFDRAIALKPDYAEAYSNRGNALRDLKRPDAALQSYERAIALKPDCAEAYSNRATMLSDLKRPEAALENWERAIDLKPDFALAHWNMSVCRLQLGDFARGWPGYEWRWKALDHLRHDHHGQPLWLGTPALQGKTVLLHAEQGFGDTLQFCRYSKLIAARGAKVVLEVQHVLLPLLAHLEGAAQVLPKGVPLPAFDYQCPLLSLPLALKTDLEGIPAGVPYIFSDPARVSVWRDRLGVKTRPRVGIVWSGFAGHKNDRNRSIELREILPLLSGGLEWVSLQKEVRGSDTEVLASRPDIRHFGEQLGDFAETAALAELMDLVVTVDTSVAHLGGAMGKPVWVLLPFNADWRWMLDREDSVWYPTAWLFRQPVMGDWASVISRVSQELMRFQSQLQDA